MAFSLHCNNIGKKYGNNWIFRGLSGSWASGSVIAVTGPNGSGKSTLIKILAGVIFSSEGSAELLNDERTLDSAEYHESMALVAPYTDLNELLTVEELTTYHFRFRVAQKNYNAEFFRLLGLEKQRKNLYKELSSGQRQRLKLGLAMHTELPVLLLDEPTSNLDEQGIQLYQSLLEKNQERLIFIASNQKDEYQMASSEIAIEEYLVK